MPYPLTVLLPERFRAISPSAAASCSLPQTVGAEAPGAANIGDGESFVDSLVRQPTTSRVALCRSLGIGISRTRRGRRACSRARVAASPMPLRSDRQTIHRRANSVSVGMILQSCIAGERQSVQPGLAVFCCCLTGRDDRRQRISLFNGAIVGRLYRVWRGDYGPMDPPDFRGSRDAPCMANRSVSGCGIPAPSSTHSSGTPQPLEQPQLHFAATPELICASSASGGPLLIARAARLTVRIS